MSRPSEAELKVALEQAGWLRENGQDQFYLGKSLLNHNYRLKHLERVLFAAKNFLHSGMANSTELTQLLKAIEAAEKADAYLGENKHLDNQNVNI